MTAPFTTGGHAHPVKAECPIMCLEGLLPSRALNELRHEMPHGTVGDVARLLLEDRLLAMRGMGPGSVERIREVLSAASLIGVLRQEAARA
jgi:hypothetical protein